MLIPGLVSVSFRSLPYDEIIRIAKAAGLKAIEWGSDVHAPKNDTARLDAIRKAGEEAGIACCSYGTYFRLGTTPITELAEYIAAAKRLGTDILRLWCGDRSTALYTDAEKRELFAVCREAARIAEKENVILCMECHPNTMTEDLCGALELMETVGSPNFRMYWQPNQHRSEEEKLKYAKTIAPYTMHLHVYNWCGNEAFPLSEGVALWRCYLENFEGDRMLLLEFMPHHLPEELQTEADALREIIGGAV